MMNKNNIPNIPAEKFRFVGEEGRMHDQKMDTKQISYFRDAFNRFCKNKSSVTAAIIIIILVMYAIFVPVLFSNNYTDNPTDTDYLMYSKLLPKNPLCVELGWNFWDGCSDEVLSENNFLALKAIQTETGLPVIKEVYETFTTTDGKKETVNYSFRKNSYLSNGFTYMTLTEDQYKSIQAWQNESGIQVIYPAVEDAKATDANIWYKTNKKGVALLNNAGEFQDVYRTSGGDGDYDSLRIPGDPGLEDPSAENRYRYARITGSSSAISYKCRIFKDAYFQYKFGHEANFYFGSTNEGRDILTRLASGARFSLIFAVCISAINLTIGAIYGAIEGYYGGMVDMLMERFTDILARVPFMVVTTLFQLHLAKQVGPVVSLLFAFVLTGWIGMAGTVRMQFYRFKGQEYVLASRVLGASDWRIMFRHIFPNSLGTIITSSVLVIPGVIFSESSLTYLGIVNLDTATMTSVGTMLANAKAYLSSHPHTIFFPAMFISLLEISFNLFGNGLRDAFNPSLRGAED